MSIDPKKRKQEREEKGWSDDGPSTNFLRTEGKMPMAVGGWERFKSSQKGTPGIMIRLVVVEGQHAGSVIDRNFWLTEKALEQLADFALAFGYEEPFDEHSDDALEKIVCNGTGVVMGTVKGEHYQKDDGSAGVRYEAKFFGPYRGTKKESWAEYVKLGEDSFARYGQWRANNPRALPGQGGGGRGGQQGGQQQGGQQGGHSSNEGQGGSYAPVNNDDVPF